MQVEAKKQVKGKQQPKQQQLQPQQQRKQEEEEEKDFTRTSRRRIVPHQPVSTESIGSVFSQALSILSGSSGGFSEEFLNRSKLRGSQLERSSSKGSKRKSSTLGEVSHQEPLLVQSPHSLHGPVGV